MSWDENIAPPEGGKIALGTPQAAPAAARAATSVAQGQAPLDPAKSEEPTWEYYEEETSPVKGLKIAITGKAKVGKSVLAASACLQDEEVNTAVGPSIPRGSPVSIMDTESASHWLTKYYGKQFKEKKIRVLPVYMEDPVTKETDPVASFEFFWKKLLEVSSMEEGTLVIDSLSDVWQWMNAYLRIKILNVGPATSGFNKDIKISDWFWRNDKYEKLMKIIRKIKANVIITAKVKPAYDSEMDEKGKLKIQKTGDYVPIWKEVTPYWMDMILDMDIKEIDNVPTRFVRCVGSRGGIPFNEEIIKPSFKKIVERITQIQPTLDF